MFSSRDIEEARTWSACFDRLVQLPRKPQGGTHGRSPYDLETSRLRAGVGEFPIGGSPTTGASVQGRYVRDLVEAELCVEQGWHSGGQETQMDRERNQIDKQCHKSQQNQS